MSRAFVREEDGGKGGDELPERSISPHANYVTSAGLALIEAELARLQAEQDAAAGDAARQARIGRDLRYWRARRSSAEVVPPPAGNATVRFGSTVTIAGEDGQKRTFRVVGEDEADPAKGSVSYMAPIARQLIGKGVGDTVQIAGGEAAIVRIA